MANRIIVTVEPQWPKLLGISIETALEEGLIEIMHDDDYDAALENQASRQAKALKRQPLPGQSTLC